MTLCALGLHDWKTVIGYAGAICEVQDCQRCSLSRSRRKYVVIGKHRRVADDEGAGERG